MMEKTYNGWSNYETWNVTLIVSNTEFLYYLARDFMKDFEGNNPYIAFINYIGYESKRTVDNIPFLSYKLDYQELNEFMLEHKE